MAVPTGLRSRPKAASRRARAEEAGLAVRESPRDSSTANRCGRSKFERAPLRLVVEHALRALMRPVRSTVAERRIVVAHPAAEGVRELELQTAASTGGRQRRTRRRTRIWRRRRCCPGPRSRDQGPRAELRKEAARLNARNRVRVPRGGHQRCLLRRQNRRVDLDLVDAFVAPAARVSHLQQVRRADLALPWRGCRTGSPDFRVFSGELVYAARGSNTGGRCRQKVRIRVSTLFRSAVTTRGKFDAFTTSRL